jgi:hypothetical protein
MDNEESARVHAATSLINLRLFSIPPKTFQTHSATNQTLDDDDSFISSGSLVYKIYKCVFHADGTSSEMTFDCSSFSDEHDDGPDDAFGDVFGDGEGHDATEEVMTPSSQLTTSVGAHDFHELLSSPPPSPPSTSSSMMEIQHLLSYVTHQDWKTFAATDEALLLRELSDRASSLLQRESCWDYAIKDFFQRRPGCCPRFPPPQSDLAAAASAVSSSNSSYLSSSSSSRLPVDSKCRSIMMDWSKRVIEFCLPNSHCHQGHQLKARLLSKTFSYVDRICTKFEIVNRDQYKLLTIVCLHLAAKISGLFKSDANVSECCESRQRRGSHYTASTSAVTSPSSSSSMSVTAHSNDSSITVESHRTIVPTPHSVGSMASPLPLQEEEEGQTTQCYSTEYIWLLSLHGLHSLCNDEFTMDEFKQMEYTILHYGLDWRLGSVVALDWIDIYLELMVLLPPPLLLCCNDDQDGNNIFGKKKLFISFTRAECDDIRDATLTQLEYALKRPCFMTCAPSLLGLAAFLNVMEGYCSNSSNDCGHELLSSIEGAIDLGIDYDDLNDIRVKMMFEVDDDDEYIGVVNGS